MRCMRFSRWACHWDTLCPAEAARGTLCGSGRRAGYEHREGVLGAAANVGWYRGPGGESAQVQRYERAAVDARSLQRRRSTVRTSDALSVRCPFPAPLIIFRGEPRPRERTRQRNRARVTGGNDHYTVVSAGNFAHVSRVTTLSFHGAFPVRHAASWSGSHGAVVMCRRGR